MMEYFLNEYPITSLLIIIAIVTAVAVVCVVVPARLAADYSCSKRAEILETDYQYSVWTGCWIKDKDGTFVEYSTVRNIGGK